MEGFIYSSFYSWEESVDGLYCVTFPEERKSDWMEFINEIHRARTSFELYTKSLDDFIKELQESFDYEMLNTITLTLIYKAFHPENLILIKAKDMSEDELYQAFQESYDDKYSSLSITLDFICSHFEGFSYKKLQHYNYIAAEQTDYEEIKGEVNCSLKLIKILPKNW